MQNIGAPAGNGHLDTILVQAEGKTGDHAERKPAFDEAMQDSGETEPNERRNQQGPEVRRVRLERTLSHAVYRP